MLSNLSSKHWVFFCFFHAVTRISGQDYHFIKLVRPEEVNRSLTPNFMCFMTISQTVQTLLFSFSSLFSFPIVVKQSEFLVTWHCDPLPLLRGVCFRCAVAHWWSPEAGERSGSCHHLPPEAGAQSCMHDGLPAPVCVCVSVCPRWCVRIPCTPPVHCQCQSRSTGPFAAQVAIDRPLMSPYGTVWESRVLCVTVCVPVCVCVCERAHVCSLRWCSCVFRVAEPRAALLRDDTVQRGAATLRPLQSTVRAMMSSPACLRCV